MSASSKKKLRNEQAAQKLTEKQLAEQKEAKKLKVYTTVFCVVLALLVVFAAWTAVSKAISNSGIRERNTVAVTIGDHEISNAELNYYYIDSINNFYNNYGSYASLFGLDVTKALDEQVTNEETGATWADDFIDSAVENAKSVYALVDAANAAGYTLSEDELASVDNQMSTMQLYATIYYGYPDLATYLKACYGNGATEESFREYCENSILAQSYYNSYCADLSYTDDEIAAENETRYNEYSAYSYNYYYLNATKFQTGGTTDEDGNTTYSDEEIAAAVAACEDAAKELTSENVTSVEVLDLMINDLSINAETTASSTACDDYAYASVLSSAKEWITDPARQEGDKTYVASTTHTHAEGEEHSDDEDTSAHDVVNGYYVIYYRGTETNEYPLANVRHILVEFEGGTTDENGNTTYSDLEKATAQEAANALYTQWKSGEATEDSFAELANAESDDGDGTTGGLYTDVYPGQMVTNFNDWCFADGRAYGDTGIVESPYGYHIMFYAGDSETTYRQHLITEGLREAESAEWYDSLLESMTSAEGNTKYINKSIVLSSK